MVMVGCGSIGRGVLPLILRHLDIRPGQISIVTADDRARAEADQLGIEYHRLPLTPQNFRSELEGRLGAGDFLVNLSVDVSSTDLVRLCSERDTQVAAVPKRVGEFVNTWSIDGFISEGSQPAELGWGTHEKSVPADGELLDTGSARAVILLRPGASVRVRSWTPLEGPFHGFLITHNEALSLNDYFTVWEDGTAVYRPTAHYAYHPCDDAVLSVHELAGKNWQAPGRQRLLLDEIESGIDELGVLLMGHARGAYWYGSRLSIGEARRLAPFNNATSLQVSIAVLSGIIWALENPAAGIVEAEDMDFTRHLELCRPYLGPLVGEYTDWTPLRDRGGLFPEAVDASDPWQFSNVRVT
jgi:homospermidine synthase